MTRKTVPYNPKGLERLPNDKPITYRIMTPSGGTNYVGSAMKGRGAERIGEHLSGAKDPVPGAKVRIEQHRSIAEAQAHEKRVIARTKPPYNKQGK